MGLGLTNLNDKDPQRGVSASNAVAVTPSDTANNFLDYNAEYLWIGGAGSGNLTVITTSGQTVTFAGVPVGFFWLRVKQVKSTGTDVTGIVAFY